MASVTQRISQIKQPYGGFLPMNCFKKENLNDGLTLNENENIHASLVGMAVDYLTRFSLGSSVDKAFHISCLGAANIGMRSKATLLKSKITGLDDLSISSACKLAGFDVCYRSTKSAYKPIEDINPDEFTIENIRIMVNRSISFWKQFGPIICSEPTFEGGYTDTVNTGDGDFLSKDTLWDFKVSKSAPTSKHSLQLLMYYIMGLHSVHEHFKSISNLGIFNPRLNTVYICPVSSISSETIIEIENNVICYGISPSYNLSSPTEKQSPIVYTVADICNITGFKKSVIYSDIRSGRLIAFKKGNKYFIAKSECDKYIEWKNHQQIILIGLAIGCVAIFILFVLFYLFMLFLLK